MNQQVGRRFGSREGFRRRAEALARYAAWEAAHPPPALEPAAAIRAVSALYRLLPPTARRREDDPEFDGVARMRAALAMLRPGPRRG